jgi:MoaA/NifB/PqqE/SkfB family radical SAM enzyme
MKGTNIMKPYINLNRIEFVITNACGSRCRHCSWGELPNSGGSVDADAAVAAINRLAGRFGIDSVMTFGGEPLLFADTVCKIHAAARECGIPRRQLITNGFFSKDEGKIDGVAKSLCESGVNDILLSVDAFHQEHIPVDHAMLFAESLLRHGVPSLRVHPAWVVDETADNAHNTETKRLLKLFASKGIPASSGNDIFPSGNALKHLSEYYPAQGRVDLSAPCGFAPHTSRLDEVDSISINPDGAVTVCSEIGNIYREDALDIVEKYDPYNIPALRAILDGGVTRLLQYAKSQGVTVDISDCRDPCGACRKIMKELNML